MRIKLSIRDVQADTKDIHHDMSETQENNPRKKQEILKMKPMIDVNIKLDKDRVETEKNISMGLNARNQIFRGK